MLTNEQKEKIYEFLEYHKFKDDNNLWEYPIKNSATFFSDMPKFDDLNILMDIIEKCCPEGYYITIENNGNTPKFIDVNIQKSIGYLKYDSYFSSGITLVDALQQVLFKLAEAKIK